jgi:hypothetical protein
LTIKLGPTLDPRLLAPLCPPRLLLRQPSLESITLDFGGERFPYETILLSPLTRLMDLRLQGIRLTAGTDFPPREFLTALRALECSFPLAPEDLPPLPPSLTRLSLKLIDPSEGLEEDARFTVTAAGTEKVLRWTNASPLSPDGCPALTSLSLSLQLYADEDEGEDMYVFEERTPYYVEVPEGLAAQLQQLKIRCTTLRYSNKPVVVRVPWGLRGRFRDLAAGVSWVEWTAAEEEGGKAARGGQGRGGPVKGLRPLRR